MTLRTLSMAGSGLASLAAMILSAARSADCGVNPRSWRLPREVRSIWPLPCSRAASAMMRAAAALRLAAVGLTRTSQPSPDGMGASKVGHQPLGAGAMFMAALRQGSAQSSCGAGATDRA